MSQCVSKNYPSPYWLFCGWYVLVLWFCFYFRHIFLLKHHLNFQKLAIDHIPE